jgi:hypothetical protein
VLNVGLAQSMLSLCPHINPPPALHGLSSLPSPLPHRQLLKTELGSFFTEYLQVGGPCWPQRAGHLLLASVELQPHSCQHGDSKDMP